MDYSASMQDENPAGASPWGNSPASSPRQSRQGFGNILGSEPPTSPFGANNGFGHDQEGGFGGQDSFRRPDTASTTSGNENEADESRPEADTQEVHPGTPFIPESGAEQSQAPGPASDAPPQGQQGQQQQQGQRPQQPQHPQFRLVAKVTGLERTGKKDPILRFDVHVSSARLDSLERKC